VEAALEVSETSVPSSRSSKSCRPKSIVSELPWYSLTNRKSSLRNQHHLVCHQNPWSETLSFSQVAEFLVETG
jgi:hypothetical protein